MIDSYLLSLFAIYHVNTNCYGAAGKFSGSEQQLSLEDFQKTPVDTVLVAAAIRRLHSAQNQGPLSQPSC